MLEQIKNRMTGWQLNTFVESYQYKLKNGLSVFKRKLLEKK